MSFEEASKKYSRLVLLIFGSLITAGLIFVPLACTLSTEQLTYLENWVDRWIILYTMIVMFYFKEKEDT